MRESHNPVHRSGAGLGLVEKIATGRREEHLIDVVARIEARRIGDPVVDPDQTGVLIGTQICHRNIL